METMASSYTITHIPVLILPMRNGNQRHPFLGTHMKSLVLILPMRNGNYCNDLGSLPYLNLGSYPTYEEWKQRKYFEDWGRKDKFLSYLWGMETFNFNFFFFFFFSSYPTYEEWKHPPKANNSKYATHVLILPMRNGNKSSPSNTREASSFLSYLWGMETRCNWWYISLIIWVLILPMRNGNISSNDVIINSVPFLSYLWGMETTSSWSVSMFGNNVLILPMRNGNYHI